MENRDVGGVETTEICNLSCVMCPFNGPNAIRLTGTLTPEQVRKFVSSVPRGPIWFASTGDFLLDPNALEHLETAVSYGHQPCVLTNGQLLTPALMDRMLAIGVREIAISVDAIEPELYRKIRRGGELSKILEVCSYLRAKKAEYPDLIVTIANVLFKNTFIRQAEFERFWVGRADRVSFQSEYYDVFKIRNTLFDPGERIDCHLRVFLLPNGQMSPCCAITGYQHNRNLDWLPHIDETTPEQALDEFKRLYADPQSPLGQLCTQCDWWMMFKQGPNGHTAFSRTVSIPDCLPGVPRETANDRESVGTFRLEDAAACNQSTVTGDRPVVVTTSADQWAFSAAFPIRDEFVPASENGALLVRLELEVMDGSVGVAVAEPSLQRFISPEKIAVSGGMTTLEIPLGKPIQGCQLIVRNVRAGGTPSRVEIHSIHTFLSN